MSGFVRLSWVVLSLALAGLGTWGVAPAAGPGPVAVAGGPSHAAPVLAAPETPTFPPNPGTNLAWENASGSQQTAPPGLVGASEAFDPELPGYVLFGGCSALACPAVASTWLYEKGSWSAATNLTEPPARAYAALAFDSVDGYLVLFGGVGAGGRVLNDTWTFQNGTWTNRTETSAAPPARYAATFAYDHARRTMILFGGMSESGSVLADTWSFFAGNWTAVPASTSPPARAFASAVWDDTDGVLVLFGGWNGTDALGDTWTYGPMGWTAPPLMGTTPSARYGAWMSYTGSPAAVYLSGGARPGDVLTDTWSFSANAWSNVTSSTGPSPAGYGAADPESTAAWPTSGPVTAGFGLLTGGTATTALSGPTLVPADPRASTAVLETKLGLTALAAPATLEAGAAVHFSSTATGGTPSYAIAWSFGDGGHASGPACSHNYTTPGNFTAVATVTDAVGAQLQATAAVEVTPGPAVRGSVTPNATDVGEAVSFQGSASGGTPTYQFHWEFGDGAAGSGASTSHAYTIPGRYVPYLTVTDAASGSATASFAVVVSPLPTLTAELPAAPAHAGTADTFEALVHNGTAPYTISWQMGDGAVESGPTVVYAYPQAGTYQVRVSVTDAVGGTDQINGTISVSNATVVSKGPTSTPSPTPRSTGWGLLPTLALLISVSAAVAAVALIYRHRRLQQLEASAAQSIAAVPAAREEGYDTEDPSASASARRQRFLRQRGG